ncbi:hypothetical protein M440DRAFT_260156 [Trichoderma longibrachiatum ATCC 18648]|uniref:Uncharacterized protein n=1 Tax=Trichoderma longibrachiatum ATCC 18648 TaxID=983965 RepID=A0A2T4CA20_TRILO|nr:hypothetical protein M440DRAFT_260156 [Trichoderma longibrachiatum ATCC 18648]
MDKAKRRRSQCLAIEAWELELPNGASHWVPEQVRQQPLPERHSPVARSSAASASPKQATLILAPWCLAWLSLMACGNSRERHGGLQPESHITATEAAHKLHYPGFLALANTVPTYRCARAWSSAEACACMRAKAQV